MEKKNPNIYQRALDIVNHRINPDIPQGGGESAPEVENAIETHGLGWTDTEEKAGFDIQWDGNMEGLDDVGGALYKVTSEVGDIASKDDLIGAKIEAVEIEEIPSPYTLSADDILTEDGKIFACSVGGVPLAVAIEDGEGSFTQFTKGVWFSKTIDGGYISRLYKEATTEEVVHQIDQKYIPDSEFTVVIDYNSIGSDTQAAYDEALAAFQAKKNVLLKKGNISIPMTGYDSEHCFFGGTVSAYLPGNIINAVYAHVGPNGNKFWWDYTIPLGANALSIADSAGYFITDTVEGALSEIGEELAGINTLIGSGVIE